MDISFQQNCPSCGAQVDVGEADHIVACPYCDGRNVLVSRGPLRFTLPSMAPPSVGQEEIIHIPYMRFKGHIYSCIGKEVEHRIVDTTQLAHGNGHMPASLGLRPQAMQIRLIGAEERGRFAALSESVKDIFTKAARLTTALTESDETLYHRSFIGETISCIYLPTYFKNGTLMDAVLNREICSMKDEDVLRHCNGVQQEWLPAFLAGRCPDCGAILTGACDSLVQECHNCATFWVEGNGRLKKIAAGIVAAQHGQSYLPFWRVSIHADGISLQSFADFLRLTNQPIVIRDQHERQELCLWVPAFKLRPSSFLQLAKNITLSQYRLPQADTTMTSGLMPVTLPLAEAVQALKAIVAASVMNKRNFMPQLPSITVKQRQAALVYLPFHTLGHDLVQDQTSVTVTRQHLHYGRTM